MNLPRWLPIAFGAVVSAASYWLRAGGPDWLVHGIPIATMLCTLGGTLYTDSLRQGQPSPPASPPAS